MDYFLYITYITAFLPLLVFLFYIKKNRNKPIRVIVYYILYSILNEALIAFLRSYLKNEDGDFEAISRASFTIIEYFFFAYFLYSSLHNAKNKKALMIGSAVFVMASVLNIYITFTSSSSSIQTFDSLTISISAIILIIFCLIYLFEKIQKPDIGFIYAKKSFWVVVGIMIYFSGTFFLFLQYSELSEQEQENFWIINWFCIILKNIFFAIAFYLPEESEKTTEHNSDLYFLQDPD